MKGNKVLPLIFGFMGSVYAVIGAVFLSLAVRAAGKLHLIFTLPEDELAFAIVGTVFAVLGVVFLVVTLCLILANVRQARLREELLAWGSRVKGTITEVRTDHTIRVNHKSPKIALVRCKLPSGEVTLRSPRLWQLVPAVGESVEVLYDPMDEKRYVILLQDEK